MIVGLRLGRVRAHVVLVSADRARIHFVTSVDEFRRGHGLAKRMQDGLLRTGGEWV